MQTKPEPGSETGSDIDSSDESVYDSGANSPFRRYVSSQGRRIRASESMSEGEGEQLKKTLDFSRAKRVKTNECISWLEASVPVTVKELGVHTRKVTDLRRALTKLISGQCESRMVVVSGPSGNGKSTTVKLLVKELMQEKAKKWANNASVSALESTVSGGDQYIVEFSISSDSHIGNSSTRYFGEFMDQCKLLTGVNERCVVIEELPNLFHTETHREFHRVLSEWLCTDPMINLPPIVLIVSEFDIAMENEWRGRAAFTIDNFVKVETVLGRAIMSSENVLWERVRFNRVAPTIMKKALQRVLNIEGVSNDQSDVCETLEYLSSFGDLRNGINELEFWYRFKRGSDGDGVGEGRESGREMFHAIGKIVYGTKHGDMEVTEFCKRFNVKGRRIGSIDIDMATAANVSVDIGNGITSFNLSCLENYGVLGNSVDERVYDLLDVFGQIDVMLGRNGNSFSNQYVENVSFYSCYGMRIACRKAVRTGEASNKKLVFSRDSKLQRKLRLTKQEVEEFTTRRRSRLLRNGNYANLSGIECATMDGYYIGAIMGSFKAKQRIYERKGKVSNGSRIRVGGEFTNLIVAEEKMDIDDESEEGLVDVNVKEYEDAFFSEVEKFESEDEFESDPIENSDDSDEFSDDSIEGELLKL
ncbi:hypothetical protein CANINC_003167 [Pichia inconspicua]|uniref:Checkpoint protein RAD24-like helical bundle domain-containing protein n=1 Tax=Pichia inconspicua TaxID=52247 RepID=A0A4T0WZF5_9ASCO|nr:hypothetical protein CANINC_003167 [[Candida] inconspicua]